MQIPSAGSGDALPDAPSEDELRGVCADLLRSWAATFAGIDSVDLGNDGEPADPVRFGVVLSFAAHSHHVTTTAADLMHTENYASAIPLLRLSYETALTAVWAAHSSESARALQNKYIGTAQKLYRNANKTGWFDGVLKPVEQDMVDVVSSAGNEAATFFNLCVALEPHGEWLYTMYRLLSGYSHPSGTVLSMYAPKNDGDVFSLSPRPPADGKAWWHAAATTLLHAGQALDRLDPEGRRRDILAEASDVIGWPEPLRLSDVAALRLTEGLNGRQATRESDDC
jgi:hypothetical protein